MKKGIIMATLLSSFINAVTPLPDYVVADVMKKEIPAVLRTPAAALSFPLNAEDQRDARTLEAKYDQEGNCAGLAAPQIGIGKKVIIFAAPNDSNLKKWRSDLTQTMEKTLWINPSYEGVGEEKAEDYEACFSVSNLAGLVKRYKKIRYKAYTIKGKLVEGRAEGFLARIIQHEVDHVNGILFTDHVPEDQLMAMDAYRAKKAAALQRNESSS